LSPESPPRRRIGGRLALVFRHDGRVRPPSTWPQELVAAARRFDYGENGALLLAREGGDAAESRSTFLTLVGALRRPDGGWLDAGEVLAAGAGDPAALDLGGLTGSALVAALDLEVPRLAATSTWVGMHPLYWTHTRSGFAAATEPSLLLPLLDRVELDEEAVPAHFLLRYVAGERTYFRGVRKLLPGMRLELSAERGESRVARPLADVLAGLPRFERIDERNIAWLDARLAGATAAWVAAADAIGAGVGNLLSGGLDSTLVQCWLTEAKPGSRARSYGFAVAAESFAFESDYAREASERLGTEHLAPRIDESSYGELFDRAIDFAAEPSFYNESWPAHFHLAETIAAQPGAPRFLFSGYGADILNGDSMADPVQKWLWLRNRPRWLERGRRALPRLRGDSRWESWVDAVETSEERPGLHHPLSHVLLTVEPELFLPAFGVEAVERCYGEVLDLEAALCASADPLERVHVAQLLATGYDPHISVTRMYGGSGLDLVHLYQDEAALASVFAFPPAIRFLRPRGPWAARFKPLQQELLRRRGHGEMLGRRKGGTTFGAELWRWLTDGALRDRFEAIERPPWLAPAALESLRHAPTYFLWNLLTFDAWTKRVLRPASIAAASAAREA